MGLFDRFKKKDEEPEFIIREQSGKVVFIKKIGSKEFKATKEEAQKSIEEAKKKYDGKLNEKVNIMGMEIEVDATDIFIKCLNESFIENYGTPEEIKELKLKQTIRDNEKIASKLRIGTEKERNRAIKIYEHNIEYGIPCSSYYDLSLLYKQNREYDKAIEVCKIGIEVFSKYGEENKLLEESIEYHEREKHVHLMVENNLNGEKFENQGNIDEAIKCYEENVNMNADTPFTYNRLASLYHWKYEFEKERDVLKLFLERCHGSKVDRMEMDIIERINNVEQFLNTGKWKYDCLPSDPKNKYYEIKEAKTILNDDKERGIKMLENIMQNGTFNNTVYNTLFQTYKKDKQFDDAIKVCERAIEVLGFFSNDRKERWSINLEKVTKQKERAMKKK